MMMIMSADAQKVASTAFVDFTKKAIQQMTVMGIGLTQSGAGSVVFQAFSVRCRRKSILWAELRRGSSAPI